MVRFKVLATGLTGTEWNSVLQFTTGVKEGSMIPAVKFIEENSVRHLKIVAQSSFQESVHFKVANIPNDVWTEVVIQQVKLGERYVIQVVVNGEMIGSIVNGDPIVFNDVDVYASNPWQVAQPGFIKDFSFH